MSLTKNPMNVLYILKMLLLSCLGSDNDIVDGDVDELDEESDESHQREADGCGNSDLLELLPVGLGASLLQTHRVLAELSEGLQLSCDLVHLYLVVGWVSCRSESSNI